MKRLLCILTLLCVLAGLCVLPLSAAEGNVTVRYGAEDLSLTLIDPLDDAGLTFDGSFGFGVATVQNGEMAITVNGQYFDCYAMTTAALPNASFTGAKYLALSIRNESDGDVYFCLQPIVTAGADGKANRRCIVRANMESVGDNAAVLGNDRHGQNVQIRNDTQRNQHITAELIGNNNRRNGITDRDDDC